ncbi:hypothetical protein CJ030_MR0G027000 [Morella rubra]|uniref:Uncharacterized protein n=1 Tax=Morella rubra TaxID=262757 RepID=A0A6A1UGB9_9ROSI|nr:hypothetical protein CJ030_MR0G027000 [Morella rubra]
MSCHSATHASKMNLKCKELALDIPWVLEPAEWPQCCIYRVPRKLRKDLYTSVSLGYSSGKHQKEGQQIKEHKEDLNKEDSPFLKLSRKYFARYDRQPKSDIRKEGKPLLHFTDLLQRFFCSPKQEPTESQSIDHLYSATKLEEAGVQFKAAKNRHLLDVKFEKGRCLEHCPYLNCSWLLNCLPCFKRLLFLDRMQPFLELPSLLVADTTECVFRNVMALEQCHYPTEAYICSYILLLDYLINTEKDVDLLVEKRLSSTS